MTEKNENKNINNDDFSPEEKIKLLNKKNLCRIAYVFLIAACVFEGVSVLISIIGAIIISALTLTLNIPILNTFIWIYPFAFLIPLAWMIPMTVKARFHSKFPSRQSCLVLGICSIIFGGPFALGGLFGLVAGILLIIADCKTSYVIASRQIYNNSESF